MYILGISVCIEEIIVCQGSPARTITCDRPDDVIDVQVAQLLFAQDTNYCTDPNINITDRVITGRGITCKNRLAFTM